MRQPSTDDGLVALAPTPAWGLAPGHSGFMMPLRMTAAALAALVACLATWAGGALGYAMRAPHGSPVPGFLLLLLLLAAASLPGLVLTTLALGREQTLAPLGVGPWGGVHATAAFEEQRALSDFRRAATFGQVSGVLAHELRQPLTAILTNAHAAQRLIGPAHPDLAEADLAEVRAILVDIARDGARAGELIGEWRASLRPARPGVLPPPEG